MRLTATLMLGIILCEFMAPSIAQAKDVSLEDQITKDENAACKRTKLNTDAIKCGMAYESVRTQFYQDRITYDEIARQKKPGEKISNMMKKIIFRSTYSAYGRVLKKFPPR